MPAGAVGGQPEAPPDDNREHSGAALGPHITGGLEALSRSSGFLPQPQSADRLPHSLDTLSRDIAGTCAPVLLQRSATPCTRCETGRNGFGVSAFATHSSLRAYLSITTQATARNLWLQEGPATSLADGPERSTSIVGPVKEVQVDYRGSIW